MKPKSTFLTLPFLFSFLVFSFLLAQVTTTVEQILENPDEYDGQTVVVTGTIENFQQKVSKRGNPYITFDLMGEYASIKVFSFGRFKFQDGQQVKVTGVFNRVKQVGRYTFYNEIDASSGSIIKIRGKK